MARIPSLSGDRKLEAGSGGCRVKKTGTGTNGCQRYRVVLSCKSSSQSYPRRSAASLLFPCCEHATPQPYVSSRGCPDDISGLMLKVLFLAMQQYIVTACLLSFRFKTREIPRPVKREGK